MNEKPGLTWTVMDQARASAVAGIILVAILCASDFLWSGFCAIENLFSTVALVILQLATSLFVFNLQRPSPWAAFFGASMMAATCLAWLRLGLLSGVHGGGFTNPNNAGPRLMFFCVAGAILSWVGFNGLFKVPSEEKKRGIGE